MRRMLVVIALILALTGYAYAQFSYQSDRGGTTTIFSPGGPFSYGTRPDGSTYTIFQPDPDGQFSYQTETGGAYRSNTSRRRYR